MNLKQNYVGGDFFFSNFCLDFYLLLSKRNHISIDLCINQFFVANKLTRSYFTNTFL